MNNSIWHDSLKLFKNSPAYDSSCDPRCLPERAVLPAAKKLLYEPHFYLGPAKFDANKVDEELKRLEEEEWAAYNNDVLKKRQAGTSKYWTAKFLRNFSEDPDFGFGETIDYLELMGKSHLVENGRCKPEHLVKTTLWNKIPTITGIISQFVNIQMCDRILISKIDGKQRVNWHSHCYYEKSYDFAYIHIPLKTNKDTEMLVHMDGVTYSQHYGLQEAWIINTQHNHAVNNATSSSRYHLLILGSFKDEILIDNINHGTRNN